MDVFTWKLELEDIISSKIKAGEHLFFLKLTILFVNLGYVLAHTVVFCILDNTNLLLSFTKAYHCKKGLIGSKGGWKLSTTLKLKSVS